MRSGVARGQEGIKEGGNHKRRASVSNRDLRKGIGSFSDVRGHLDALDSRTQQRKMKCKRKVHELAQSHGMAKVGGGGGGGLLGEKTGAVIKTRLRDVEGTGGGRI